MLRKYKLILGAFDSVTANICSSNRKVDYIWASSLIMSAMLGKKDSGIVDIKDFLPILNGIIVGSRKPVILDFDVGGKNIKEFKKNLRILKKLSLGGICIEDESWPKINAVLYDSKRIMIAPMEMAEKIKAIKEIMGTKILIIARSHALIACESFKKIENRIRCYENTEANIICLHYTGAAWGRFKKTVEKLRIKKPFLIIISRANQIPSSLSDLRFDYILFPNQIYRIMTGSILSSEYRKNLCHLNFNNDKIISINKLFELIHE